jgi:ubiquitin-protein ligase
MAFGLFIEAREHFARFILLCSAIFMLYIIGHYAGGVFKFNVIFSEQYPQEPPTVNFITPIFHPLIRADGLLNVEAGFPKWRFVAPFVFGMVSQFIQIV